MKYLLTCLALGIAFAAGAQFSSWNPDYDEDGLIGASDLLALLSVFGIDDDGDGIWGGADLCTDLTACNFQANPSEECQYFDAVGACGGFCEDDINEDGICDWECGVDSVHFEGHFYPTTQIGEQCWLAESIRYLPEVTPASESNGYLPMAIVPGYFGDDIEEAIATDTYQNLGCLYNRTAFEDWELCPSGWHVPDFNSGGFQDLVDQVGGNAVAGAKLKDDILWNGMDEYDFSFLPIPHPAWTTQIGAWVGGVGTYPPVLWFYDADDVAFHNRYRSEYYQVRCMKVF